MTIDRTDYLTFEEKMILNDIEELKEKDEALKKETFSKDDLTKKLKTLVDELAKLKN